MPQELDVTSFLARSTDVLSAPIDLTVVIFSPARGMYYALDEVATAIWDALAEPTRFGDICAHLQREFDVHPDECEGDVRALLADWFVQGLVTTVDPDHA